MREFTIVILPSLNRETLSVIGDILSLISFFFSIISLILTILVLYNTRKIRSYYKFKGMGPALIRELRKYSFNLSSYLNEYSGSLPQISEALALSRVKLKVLEKIVTGPPNASVKRLLKSINQCKIRSDNEEEIQKLYLDIIEVIEELKDHQKNLDWEM